ncbi:hypothetical protein EIP86_011393, partial [Pleurotus ostreatoroseus]
ADGVNSPTPATKFSPTGPSAPSECSNLQPVAQDCAFVCKSSDQTSGSAPCEDLTVLCASRYALISAAPVVGLGKGAWLADCGTLDDALARALDMEDAREATDIDADALEAAEDDNTAEDASDALGMAEGTPEDADATLEPCEVPPTLGVASASLALALADSAKLSDGLATTGVVRLEAVAEPALDGALEAGREVVSETDDWLTAEASEDAAADELETGVDAAPETAVTDSRLLDSALDTAEAASGEVEVVNTTLLTALLEDRLVVDTAGALTTAELELEATAKLEDSAVELANESDELGKAAELVPSVVAAEDAALELDAMLATGSDVDAAWDEGSEEEEESAAAEDVDDATGENAGEENATNDDDTDTEREEDETGCGEEETSPETAEETKDDDDDEGIAEVGTSASLEEDPSKGVEDAVSDGVASGEVEGTELEDPEGPDARNEGSTAEDDTEDENEAKGDDEDLSTALLSLPERTIRGSSTGRE